MCLERSKPSILERMIFVDAIRTELMPGVILTCLKNNKFKTGCLSLNLITQLSRENAARNAVIPHVLRRGTGLHPDMDSILAALDGLYGSSIEPSVRKYGEMQTVGFHASFPEDAFIPQGKILDGVLPLLGEMLLNPRTRGGLLLPAYVSGEKDKLLEKIRGRINDKRAYSLFRLKELMCCTEDYAVGPLGNEAEAEAIHYQRLTRHYRELLSSSPIEIIYCGMADPDTVSAMLTDVLASLPRADLNEDLGTDIRMNTLEDSPRYFSEALDVTQGKLAMGFRLGDCMDDPDPAALRVFNALYGGSVTSKLFMNVREKLSLCYFASSAVDFHKGVMLVSSGIDFDKYDAAKDEILIQLDAVRNGDFSSDELEAARRAVSTELRTISDDPNELTRFWLSQNLAGLDCSPEDLAALAEEITAEEIVEIARGVELDAVYFLHGEEVNENADA